jgi:ferredoxin--NADP+ reductase
LVDIDGNLKARDTGEREELACDLILRSVGYTGVPLRGVPFDERRGTILNEDGRVLESHGGDHRTGHYTAGWIKRGPSGVIGTNKKCATETVAHVFEDVAAGRLLDPASPDPNSIEELLRERGTHYVSFSGWEKIDAAEVGKGEPHGRPRVKFVRIDEMLETAAEQAEAGAATGGE